MCQSHCLIVGHKSTLIVQLLKSEVRGWCHQNPAHMSPPPKQTKQPMASSSWSLSNIRSFSPLNAHASFVQTSTSGLDQHCFIYSTFIHNQTHFYKTLIFQSIHRTTMYCLVMLMWVYLYKDTTVIYVNQVVILSSKVYRHIKELCFTFTLRLLINLAFIFRSFISFLSHSLTYCFALKGNACMKYISREHWIMPHTTV